MHPSNVADIVSPEVRSAIMSRIRSRDTAPELLLRRELFASGCRYRVHYRGAPGSPDIAFPGLQLAVFVHGCFWHGCPLHYTAPKSSRAFWRAKLGENRKRDRNRRLLLKRRGWSVLEFWEHEVEADPRACAKKVVAVIRRLRAKPLGPNGPRTRPGGGGLRSRLG